MRRQAPWTSAVGLFLLLAGLVPGEALAVSKVRRAFQRQAGAPPAQISVVRAALGGRPAVSVAAKIAPSGLRALASAEPSQPRGDDSQHAAKPSGGQAGPEGQAARESLVERLGAQAQRAGQLSGGSVLRDESAQDEARKLADLAAPDQPRPQAIPEGAASSGAVEAGGRASRPPYGSALAAGGQESLGAKAVVEPPAAGPRAGSSRNEEKERLHRAALKRSIGLGLALAAVEFAGGVATGSLPVRADAMHLASDRVVDGVALAALWMSARPATIKLLSAAAISAMAAHSLVEAVGALMVPAAAAGGESVWITAPLVAIGLISNAVSAKILYPYRNESLKGAFLHAAADAAGSFGVIAAMILRHALGISWADPAATLLIVALMAGMVWTLVSEAWTELQASRPKP